MEQIDILKEEGDDIGLAYIYAVIARRIIFYDITNVTAQADAELPTDFTTARLRMQRNMHLYQD